VLPVQGNVYMLVANGRNITASVGPDGTMLVNTGPEEMSEEIAAALSELALRTNSPSTNGCFGMSCPNVPSGWTSPYTNAVISSPAPPRPLRYILNTNAAPHNVGGNAALSAIGSGRDGGARIIAHENALIAMSGPEDDPWSTPVDAWPDEAFYSDIYKMTAYFNGEAVIAYHEPEATTDGDMIVFFRHSEVISAGDIFSTVSYPMIEEDRGGSVQGVLDGLNHILDTAVAEYRSQGGTWVIPGRGRLADVGDVAAYRNMVQIITDRVQNMIEDGMSLDAVREAGPTRDFDPRYGSEAGEWTTDMFVEAVYRSLAGE
jgi:hypothetical protein